MRFRRLGMTRYGRFTDFTLDFGEPPTDGPDLHLIFGANEAGKSTILSGLIEFLFGMAARTPYDFLHSYADMRLDGEVERNGETLALTRIKRPRNSLLDAHGAAVPESVLGRAADLGQTPYMSMFSLNDESLKAGAADLLAAKGDFGEILFGASAGLGQISGKLEAIRAEAEEIFRPRAQNTVLQELKRQFDEAGEALAAADLSTGRYETLQTERDQAAKAAEAADRKEKEAGQALARLERLDAGLDAYRSLQDARRALANLPDAPEPKPGWSDQATVLAREDKAVRQARTEAEAALKRLEEDAAKLSPDPIALALAGRIEALEPLASRNATAVADLPNRRAEADADAANAQALAGYVGQGDVDDPSTLALAAPLRSRLARMLTEWAGLTGSLTAARKAAENAQASGDAGDANSLTPEQRAGLTAAIERADASDATAEAAAAGRQAAALEASHAQALQRLAPWSGDAETLWTLPVPSDGAVDRWRDARNRHDDAHRRLKDRRDDLLSERREIERQQATSSGDAALDAAAYQALRSERDAAWDVHLADMTPKTASGFAKTMSAHDDASDARMAAAERVAELAALSARAAELDAGVEETERKIKAVDQDYAPTAEAIAKAAALFGFPADMALDDFIDWLRRRAEALEARDKAAAETNRAAALQADADAEADRLRQAIRAAGAEVADLADIDIQTRLARDLLAHADRAANHANELKRAAKEIETAEQALEVWRTDWTGALADCWLEGFVDAPEDIRPVLETLGELETAVRARDQMRERIARMEQDVAAYAEAVDDLSGALGMEPTEGDAATRGREIAKRLVDARATDKRAGELAGQIEEARARLAQRQTDLDVHQAAIAEMAAHFDVDGLEGVLGAMEVAAKRARLQEEASAHATAVRRAATTENLETAEAVFVDLTPDSLAADIAQAREKAAASSKTARDADHGFRLADAAVTSLAGDADAAEIAQRRQTVLEEYAEAARTHLKLKLGVLATERALDRYRQNHRSGMLDRASEVFERITRGSFSGLRTRSGSGREELVALRASGAAAMQDAAMSTATRAQLYLALRIAGYEEFAKRGAPPPFVADDIIETFDDDRATETFGVLADMARIGQVIYFTHHAHLLEIARAAAPGVAIHELPDPLQN